MREVTEITEIESEAGFCTCFHVALRPRGRDGLLGTGTEWEGDERMKARPRKTFDCRQDNGSIKAVSPRHCPATCALRNCCFSCCAGQSH